MANEADTTTTHPAKDPAALQREGTRQFDEAIAGKGPAMPKSANATAHRENEALLDKALKDSFPASDPPAPASPNASPGAPKGRESA